MYIYFHRCSLAVNPTTDDDDEEENITLSLPRQRLIRFRIPSRSPTKPRLGAIAFLRTWITCAANGTMINGLIVQQNK